MTSSIDSTGAHFDTLAEIKSDILDRFRSDFGENIKTDDQSVFGVLANIFAEIVSDQNDLIREVINARNPFTASGVHLSNIVQFNGVTRRNPEYSTVALTVTANTAGATVPAGSLVQDPNDSSVEFATDSELIVAPSATGTVSATATTAGAIDAANGTLTKIVNPIYGWAGVTNSADAVPGRIAEIDADLRSRRRAISRQHGLQSLPALRRALSNIDAIGTFEVYENNTNLVDEYGQPGNSVWSICQGGADADIAEALYNGVSAGIATYGSTTVAHTDPDSGDTYAIYFGRPTEIPIKIYIKIRRYSTYPSDGDTQIKNAIVAYFDSEFVLPDGETNNGFGIGEAVEYFRLLTPINSIGGFSIEQYQIAKIGDSYGVSNISIGRTELASIDSTDIEIEYY